MSEKYNIPEPNSLDSMEGAVLLTDENLKLATKTDPNLLKFLEISEGELGPSIKMLKKMSEIIQGIDTKNLISLECFLEQLAGSKEGYDTRSFDGSNMENAFSTAISDFLRELKEEAGRNDVQFDRKQAFGQAAREWTAKKNK